MTAGFGRVAREKLLARVRRLTESVIWLSYSIFTSTTLNIEIGSLKCVDQFRGKRTFLLAQHYPCLAIRISRASGLAIGCLVEYDRDAEDYR